MPLTGRLRAVLGAPGAPPLVAARTLGALPIGMVPLAIVLLLRSAGDSYALAGLATGAFALGVAVASPLLGRLVDRVGIARVLTPLSLTFPASVVALTLAGSRHAPAAATIAFALLAGANYPPVGPCMRALWPRLLDDASLRTVAFSVEATLQELAFVGGPPILAGVVALAGPVAGLIVTAVAGGAGALIFALRARPYRASPVAAAGGALRSAGVRDLLVVSAVLGGAFGAFEVAMPAFGERHGSRPAAGIMLAALALGSACGGAVFSARASRVAPAKRLLVALVGYAALALPLLAAPSIAAMAALALFAGVPIAPAFAGTYLLLDHFSVPGTATETFAWNTTVVFAGAAAGNALGGGLIASSGYRGSLVLAAALAGTSALLVAANVRRGRLSV